MGWSGAVGGAAVRGGRLVRRTEAERVWEDAATLICGGMKGRVGQGS